MKSQYAGECSICKNKWNVGDEIHISKNGDSWIKCTDEQCFKEQGGKVYEKKPKFTSSKFSIDKAVEIYGLGETLLESFQKKHGDLNIEQKAQFVESMFKTLSGSYK